MLAELIVENPTQRFQEPEQTLLGLAAHLNGTPTFARVGKKLVWKALVENGSDDHID